jgi:hypothetical protein
MSGKYKVHRFDIRMTEDQNKLEEFLNSLKGEVIAVIPNITTTIGNYAAVNFLLIIEKTESSGFTIG